MISAKAEFIIIKLRRKIVFITSPWQGSYSSKKTLFLLAKNAEENKKLKEKYDDDLRSSELKFSEKIIELHTELSNINLSGMQLNANCRKVRGKAETGVLERDTAKVEELYFRAELAEESARKLTESLRIIEEGKLACKAMEKFILEHAIIK